PPSPPAPRHPQAGFANKLQPATARASLRARLGPGQDSGQGPRSLETWLNSGQEVKNRKMVPGSAGQPGSWLGRADLEIKAEKAQKRLWEVFTEPDVLKHLLV
ncbi:unnamed protein product, partial [Gulo gulo]